MNLKRGIIIGIVVLIGAFLVSNYNRLVRLDTEVDGAWAQVENVVKRRSDLIPNLVNTVKGYAEHESDTFTKVIEARNKVSNANSPEELSEANSELTKAIGGINVLVEAYPELKANESFLDLQAQLEGTENRIATERQRYNETVTGFNKTIKSFPTNILAKLLGFEAREYFQIDESDRQAPEVNF